MDGAETPQDVRRTALNSQIFQRHASFQKSRTLRHPPESKSCAILLKGYAAVGAGDMRGDVAIVCGQNGGLGLFAVFGDVTGDRLKQLRQIDDQLF
jgi:hypothetical protein